MGEPLFEPRATVSKTLKLVCDHPCGKISAGEIISPHTGVKIAQLKKINGWTLTTRG